MEIYFSRFSIVRHAKSLPQEIIASELGALRHGITQDDKISNLKRSNIEIGNIFLFFGIFVFSLNH